MTGSPAAPVSGSLGHREEMCGQLERLGLSCWASGYGLGGWDLALTGGGLDITVYYGEEGYLLYAAPETADDDDLPEEQTHASGDALLAAVSALLARPDAEPARPDRA